MKNTKNTYLVTPSCFQTLYWIVEAETPGEAIAINYNIEKHPCAVIREDARQLLINNGFNKIELTQYKNIFKLY